MNMKTGVGAFLGVLMLIPVVALAAEFRAAEQISLPANQSIQDDLYIAGGTVTSAGDVSGDVVAGGGNVLVSGAIGADLTAAGGTVTVLSDVADDVRVAGGTIIIQGKIGDDLLVGGGQVTVGGAGIGGDVTIGGGTIHIEAPVSGNIKIGGGEVYLNAPVGGNVEFMGDTLKLGSGAVISGDLIYTSPKKAVMEEGAVVRGETKYTAGKDARALSKTGLVALLSLALFGAFLTQFACALLLGLMFRRYATTLVENAVAQPLLEMGRGLVVFIVLPVVSVLLFFTLIGVPLGFLGLFAFIATMLAIWIMVPIVLGSIVHRAFFKTAAYEVSWKTILLGTALYVLVGIVPLLGGIAQFALILLTLGAALKLKWDIAKEWR
jgi:hypothetical protein